MSKKYTVEGIVNNNYEEKIIVLCKTPEECEALINYYVKNFNNEDSLFDVECDYQYPNEMHIDLGGSEWRYSDLKYFYDYPEEIQNALIVPFSEVSLQSRIRGFEVVEKRKTNAEEIILPKRATSQSMAYDFFSPISAVVQPNDIVKIWTDVKAYMQNGEGLLLNVRSSMGGKFMLANSQGWIEPDYYNNEGNEGNIGFFLKNISNEPITINKGDRIGQGMFIPFLVSDNGNPEEEIARTGGFGSTGK